MVTPDPGVIEVNVQPTVELGRAGRAHHRPVRRSPASAGWAPRRSRLDGRHSGTGGGNHITLGGAEPGRRRRCCAGPDLLVSMLTYWQHHPSLSYLFSGRFIGPTSQAPRVDEGRPETLYELEIAFAEIDRLTGRRERPALGGRPGAAAPADRHHRQHPPRRVLHRQAVQPGLRRAAGSACWSCAGSRCRRTPTMALVQALLVRCAGGPVRPRSRTPAPLVRWGTALHERFLLPHFVRRRHGRRGRRPAARTGSTFDLSLARRRSWSSASRGSARRQIGDVPLELRSAIEPWHVLGEEATAGGTARYVDSSVERRAGARRRAASPAGTCVTCNGVPVPLQPTGTPGEYVAGVRYRAWKPWSALHPTLEIDAPLTFELVDLGERGLARRRDLSRHPPGRAFVRSPAGEREGGRGPAGPPVRGDGAHYRGDRHRRPRLAAPPGGATRADDYPLTLDLRRRLPKSWGRS